MDDDDRLLDVHEENELQEFSEQPFQGGGYKYQPLSVAGKAQKAVFAVGKIGSISLVTVLLAMFFVLVVLLGVTVQTLIQLNTMKSCDYTVDNSSASSAADSGACAGQSTAGSDPFAQNVTAMLRQVLQTTGDSAQKLIEIVGTLSNIESTGTNTAGVIDDILLVVNQLMELQNESSSSPALFTSCKEIKQRDPNSPSGVYLVAHAADGSGDTYAYCNMGELCGSGGGWTRLAYLNMNDATKECPSGFRLYQSGGVRACGRPTSSGGSCVSVQFPSNGISYSQVCGRVVGYQYGTPDAVDNRFSGHNDINSWYVDGVSITHGFPRHHVWTLMAGHSQSLNRSIDNCPCSNDSTQQTQSFVGSDYFCESGNPTNNGNTGKLYTSDPLWDGQGCGPVEKACCSAPGLPWFHRDYGNTTADFLELRVCGDEGTNNEDVPVSYYEIYVN